LTLPKFLHLTLIAMRMAAWLVSRRARLLLLWLALLLRVLSLGLVLLLGLLWLLWLLWLFLLHEQLKWI
jgi:hypothetical protein